MRSLLLILTLMMPSMLWADPPEIVRATAEKSGMGWRVMVTLKHPEETWDHYADAWEIRDMAGNVIATRELAHPHEPGRPFTRSLSAVMIPDGTRKVMIFARCNRDGWGENGFKLKLRP